MIKIRMFAIAVAAVALTAVRAPGQTLETLSLVGASGKICQLNGDTDWASGAHTAARTQSNFGMEAADLGAPVDTGGSTLYFLFGDTWPANHPPLSLPQVPPDDSVGTSTQNAAPTSSTCLGLQLATSTSAPPTLARPTVTPAIDQGFFNVPSGGVYVGGSLYEFFWANHCPKPNPLPASPSDPLLLPAISANCFETPTLNSIGISVLGQWAGASDTTFNQATVGGTTVTMPSGFVYVNAVDATLSPNLAPSGQRFVFITGVPRYRASVPYLAYSTAANIGDPSQWMFFNGLSGRAPNWISYATWESNHNSAGRWVPPSSALIYSAAAAEQCIGEHSLTWNAPLGVWLLIYNCNVTGQHQIEARYAPAPWGPWSDPIVVLSPMHDPGIFCTLVMSPSGCPSLKNYQPLNKDGTYQYGLYAPFVMSRFTQDETEPGPPCEPVVNRATGRTVWTCVFRATIYWLLSTWNPYFVVVMKSTLKRTTRSIPLLVKDTISPSIPPTVSSPPFEFGINRLGADYRSFSPRGGPRDCQVACGDDDRCRAWTYVRQGIQGPSARCWLKGSVPQPTRNDCCVSGVMR